MECPRCKVQLDPVTINESGLTIQIDKCNTCEGIWFDQGELSLIDQKIDPSLLKIRKIPGRKEQKIPLYCPSCEDQVLMKKSIHPRDHKVIMDYCPSCKGIWLDKGELEAIQKENWLITAGNLHRWLMNQ